ncbi:MFS multidrug transporter [Phlyctema vagabunda]|uniref:MFS multidrug transporter n=1 Tax=Phlyctema vagabunda TaxID=108571 RepID=A0ABR4PW94_9HELO
MEDLETAEPSKTQHKVEKKSRAFKLAFISLCACSFISTLDTVIIAAALPAIAKALDATSNQAYWNGTGFLFAQAAFQPVYGALSEIFGRKYCLLVALTIFTIASVLCAAAQDIFWLIGARVFQGLGAGGINALCTIIIADMVALRERSKYVGFLGLVSSVALISGYILGASISERSTWRLVFYINLPVCIPTIVGLLKFLHLQATPLTLKENLLRADWIGMVILTSSLISLLFGVTSGGVLYSWSSANVLSALIAGGVGVIIFALHESFTAKYPMMPPRMFANRTSVSAYFSSFVLGLTLWAMEYYLILYFLVTQQKSLLGSAVAILPGTSFVPVFAAASGFIMAYTKRFKILNSTSLVLMSLGFGLTSLLRPDSSKAVQFGFQVLYGIGGGMLFPGRQVAIQASQADEDVPMASALSSFTVSLGEAFGVAIGGSIFQNVWRHKVARCISDGLIPTEYFLTDHEAEQAVNLIKEFPEPVRVIYRRITSEGINVIFIVLAIFAAVATLGSFISRDISLDKDSGSSQKFVEEKAEKTEKTQKTELVTSVETSTISGKESIVR